MVQLCLTVHVQEELQGSDEAFSRPDCARIFIRVTAPENVCLAELAYEVERLWNEIHPGTE